MHEPRQHVSANVIGAEQKATVAPGLPRRWLENCVAVLFEGRVWREQIGPKGNDEHHNNKAKSRKSSAVVAEILPKFLEGVRRRSESARRGLRCHRFICHAGVSAGMSNARVDHTVEHVNDEVHQNDDAGDQQNASLNCRIIASSDGVD